MIERRVNKVDKYEYKLRADEIKSLIQEKKYKDAVAIADTIDWKNVKNSVMLCTISDLYKVTKRYSDSREVLLLAYDRNPSSRMILYSLCELSIKLGDVINAIEFYKEFVQVAPHDTGKYILHYKLISAEGGSIEERIELLEELQKKECKEKWMYELANLYHIAGESEKCIEECNQIVIYFGEGKYVIKALELMATHRPLTPDQEFLYARLTNPVDTNIVVNTMDVSTYNPDDLQKELANNLKEVLSEESSVNTQAVSEQEVVYVSEAELYGSESEVVAEPIFESESVAVEQTVAPIDVSKEDSIEEVSFDTTMYKPVTVVEEDVEEATKVIDTKAVNKALSETTTPVVESRSAEEEPKIEAKHITPPSEIDFKGQVIEPKKPSSVWDMHEIEFGNKNSEAIKYPNYDDMVSLEGDGQISIVLPEQERIDKQITGQISIDDILLEWERIKSESDRKWQEDVKQRVISQTTDLFKNFEEASRNGLLEELEISVAGGEKVVLTVDEQVALLNAENPEALNFSVDDMGSEVIIDGEEIIILEEDLPESENNFEGTYTSESETVEALPIESETIETDHEEIVPEISEETSESESDIQETEVTSTEEEIATEPVEEVKEVSGDIFEIKNDEPETEDEPVNEDPSPEELYFDRTPFLSDEKEEVSDDTAVLPKLENLDYFMQYAAASEEHDAAEKIIFGAAEIIAAESDEEQKEEESTEEKPVEVETTEETIEEESVEEDSEVDETQEVTEEEPETADVAPEADTEEKPYVKFFDDGDETEEAAEESETVEESENTESETSQEDDIASEETEESEEPKTEDSVEAESEAEEYDGPLTESQLVRFEDFIQNENAEEQIADALARISMDATHGNVIIGSDDIDGAVELGKALITEVAETGELTGKVAKIKASTLNAKDVKATLGDLYGGAIIIQDISDLKPESLAALKEIVSAPDKKILVVLTANQRLKHKFIMDNKEIMEYFDVSLDTVSLDDRDLVNLGLKYANEQEFAIDELGLLALHRIVGERQTNSHAVTVSEVKGIIDDAIDHASRKNVGHFFDILVGKRYDDNDMIVLREKDFE